MSHTKPRFTTWEPEESWVRLALKRCDGFAEGAVSQSHIGRDFLSTLIASAYLQGANDAAEVIHNRREGNYEEQR